MTTLYLIRHCEAENNRYRRCCGQYDCGVTPRGRRQADALARRFHDIPLDAVYASDLYRTRRTAAPLAADHGLEVRPFSGLREMHMGRWENRSWSDIRRMDPAGVDLFWNHLDEVDLRAGGGESVEGVARRIYQNIELLCRLHEGGTLALVSHGMAIRTFCHRVTGLPARELNRFPLPPNTGVGLARFAEGRFTLEYLNDATHIDPEKRGVEPTELRPRPITLPEELMFVHPASEEELAAIGGIIRAEGLERGPDEGLFAAVDEAGALAGFLSLEAGEGDRMLLRSIYLKPDYRGRGLGMQLMGEAVARSDELGRARLCVRLSGKWAETRPYFDENSFTPGEDGLLERPVKAPSLL